MKDISALRLLIYVVTFFTVIIVGIPVSCAGVNMLKHPAPLGRSTAAMERHIDKWLPSSTSLDSAQQILQRHGIEFSVYSTAKDLELFARDSLAVGGPVLTVHQSKIADGWLCTFSGNIDLYFTRDSLLAGRHAQLSSDDCL